MKQKILTSFLAVMLLATAFTSNAATTMPNNVVTTMPATSTDAQKATRLAEIEKRVFEIKNMDKSHLSRQDRKALRAELRMLGKDARSNGGIYLSVGAIIIIILLLILIL